ncbi:hypothetical protein [Cupriavidus sp. UYPR2.512]|uniref:hypothetical protein n=1 Tax=Cupriavidus sp. UYPR2.512 TaxID=1080187 RepID=UPI00039F4153|nr:hypothetical protein [Cupriavidus sp. UYPR2.512]UIF89452.1 hypothetical protein KAF44_29735 [Cupriavidus necator]
MCHSNSKCLWVVAVPAEAAVKPNCLIFFQDSAPTSAQVFERTGGTVDLPDGAVQALNLTTAIGCDAASLVSLDAWGREVLAEGLPLRPLIEVPANAFSVVPSKRVHYGTKEQYFDDGGCLQGEIHYGHDGRPNRWLLDRHLAC